MEVTLLASDTFVMNKLRMRVLQSPQCWKPLPPQHKLLHRTVKCGADAGDQKRPESLFAKELAKRSGQTEQPVESEEQKVDKTQPKSSSVSPSTIEQLSRLLGETDTDSATSSGSINTQPSTDRPGSFDEAARNDPNARRAKPIPSTSKQQQKGYDDDGWSKPWDVSDKAYSQYNKGRTYTREDYPKMSDAQWEDIQKRQAALDDDGLGGLLPRVRELLKLGATFWIPYNAPLFLLAIIVIVYLNASGQSLTVEGRYVRDNPVPSEIQKEIYEMANQSVDTKRQAILERVSALEGYVRIDEEAAMTDLFPVEKMLDTVQ